MKGTRERGRMGNDERRLGKQVRSRRERRRMRKKSKRKRTSDKRIYRFRWRLEQCASGGERRGAGVGWWGIIWNGEAYGGLAGGLRGEMCGGSGVQGEVQAGRPAVACGEPQCGGDGSAGRG